mgnify:CR=1 FL=1
MRGPNQPWGESDPESIRGSGFGQSSWQLATPYRWSCTALHEGPIQTPCPANVASVPNLAANPQRLFVSSLTRGPLPPPGHRRTACWSADNTGPVHTNPADLTRVKGTASTAVLDKKGDEHGQHLWLTRIDDPKAPR